MAYLYPYGDSQQLNLDWILAKLKELEASGGAGGAGLEEVANALISLTYNTSTAYQRYDYAFLNGKLYRCLTNTSGVFNPTAWQEALIGDDLAVLTRWINAIDAAAVVDVKFDTSGTNGKIQQKYNDQYHDVVEVDYTPVQNSKRPLSSNAGYELNGAINNFRPNQLKRKWIFIGDSYGYGTNLTPSHQGWIDNLVTLLGLTSNDYYSSAINGKNFLGGDNGFLGMLKTLEASMSSAEKSTITDIVVCGGANDKGNTASNISAAVKTFNTYAKTAFPNARQYIGDITGSNNTALIAPQYAIQTQIGYRDCGTMIYLNNLEYVLHDRSLLSSDGVHPTASGYTYLAQKIYDALNGGCAVSYYGQGEYNVPDASLNKMGTAHTYQINIDNGITNLRFPDVFGWTQADPDNITYHPAMSMNSPFLICSLPQSLIYAPNNDNRHMTPFFVNCYATVQSNINNNFFQVMGYLTIVERNVYFVPRDQILGTTSAFSQIKNCSIVALSMTAPSILC